MTYRAGIATRSRILDATRQLLADGGLEAATVKAICAQAGVLPGSFYHLFPSKEEAVLTVVKEAIAAVQPPSGPRETVSGLVDSFVKFITSEPVIARVYLVMAISGGLTDPSLRRRVLRHHQARVERFAQAIRRQGAGRSPTRAGDRAEALVAALTGYAIHGILSPDFDLAKQAERLLDL